MDHILDVATANISYASALAPHAPLPRAGKDRRP